MPGTLFFIFASCEPLSEKKKLPPYFGLGVGQMSIFSEQGGLLKLGVEQGYIVTTPPGDIFVLLPIQKYCCFVLETFGVHFLRMKYNNVLRVLHYHLL